MDVLKKFRFLQNYEISVGKAEAVSQVIIVFLMTISLLILCLPQIEPLVQSLPCCDGFYKCDTLLIIRFSFVYVLVLVFCAIMDLMRSFRSQIISGLSFAKILVLVCGCWASTYIQPPDFDRTWVDALLFGAMTFICMQVYVLIRFSYAAIVKLQRRFEEGSVWFERFQVVLFVSGVVAPVVGEILLIYFYPLCELNIVLLITNSLIPFIACLWSMSDCVKARNGYSGFAQGGIFACLIVFYTWSAFMDEPDPECNPYFGYMGLIRVMQCVFVIFAHVVYIIGVAFTYNVYVKDMEESYTIVERDSARTAAVREEVVHVYNPQFNSFLCSSMMCFVVMTILNWAPIDVSADVVKDFKTAMWFKLVGCWFSVLFFVITLYTPRLYGIYPARYFGQKI